jgi:hypothetical protein
MNFEHNKYPCLGGEQGQQKTPKKGLWVLTRPTTTTTTISTERFEVLELVRNFENFQTSWNHDFNTL